jgi:chaperonin GroES
MIKPVDDKVVVKVIKESEKESTSGFILSFAEEKPNEAVVVAVGPGLMLDNGVLMKPDLSVGDKVVFAKYQGTEVTFEHKDYLILAYRDIVAVIQD